MKSHLAHIPARRRDILAIALLALVSPTAAEPMETSPVPPPAPTPPPAAAEPKPAPARPTIRFRGKAGAPTTTTLTATRSDGQPDVTLIAMAPGNEGITLRPQPRLWWWQSASTAATDLQFVLSRMDGPAPQVIIGPRALPAMDAGYNHIDLRNPRLNPDAITLENGATYQWTIVLAKEDNSPQVFCRITARFDDTATDIASLADSGNWYELFDLVSTSAEAEGAPTSLHTLRNEIITQAGLTPPK